MIHEVISHVTGCRNPQCPTHSQSKKRLSFNLQYSDKKNEIELSTCILTSPTNTIHGLKEDLLNFLYLDGICPEEMTLIGFSDDTDNFHPLYTVDVSKTVGDFNWTDGFTIYFEPLHPLAPLKQCQLTIFGPDEKEKVLFEWYREKTTLKMLFEYVIKKFSLDSVDPQQIHLFTICDELNLVSGFDQRLRLLGIDDRMAVYVQIVASPSLLMVESSINIKCNDGHESFTIKLLDSETIGDLKNSIQKRHNENFIIDLTLFDENNHSLYWHKEDQDFKSFGIKSGQTIFANYRLIEEKIQSTVANNSRTVVKSSSASLSRKTDRKKALVVCRFPTGDSEHLEVLLEDPIDQLNKRIKTLQENKRLILSALSTNTVKFQVTMQDDLYQSFNDLGFQPNDTIDVIVKERRRTRSSIISKKSASSIIEAELSKLDSTSKIPIGLDNLGNTCYMNSALQCLVHIPPLTNFFLKGFDYTHMHDGEHTDTDWNPYDQVGDVTGAYADLLWNLWRFDENNSDYRSFKPTRIKDIIGRMKPHFATNEQQDAQEFMSFLLDTIHEELKGKNNSEKNNIIKELFYGAIKSTIRCSACDHEEISINPVSFLSIPLNRQERKFGIKYIEKTGVDHDIYVHVPLNGQVGHIAEEFAKSIKRPSLFKYLLAILPDGELDFEMPLSKIPHDEIILMEQEEPSNNRLPERLKIPQEQSTLLNCLKNFFSLEYLDDERTCPQKECSKKAIATKQLELCKLPALLVIQFKRFSHENGLHQKVETFVDYPMEKLNLKAFLPKYQQETVYDLIATINHMGSIYGGHYISYAKHRVSNKYEWYRFDDSCITKVECEDLRWEIVSRDAYLLFYIRKDILNAVTPL